MSVSSLFGVGAGPVVVAVRFFSQWLCTALNIIVYRQRPFFERKDGRAMLARCVFGILRYVRLCVCVCVCVSVCSLHAVWVGSVPSHVHCTRGHIPAWSSSVRELCLVKSFAAFCVDTIALEGQLQTWP